MLERPDELACRAKRPLANKTGQPIGLNFMGRVKKTSKKNCQIEYKFKSDQHTRIVLQHGGFNQDIFILDYGFPFS